jgi:hypothetical protein
MIMSGRPTWDYDVLVTALKGFQIFVGGDFKAGRLVSARRKGVKNRGQNNLTQEA